MFLSAISPTRSLLATHCPPKSGTSNISGQTRLVIKCYDSKVATSSLKFSLSALVSSSSITADNTNLISGDNDEEGNGNDKIPTISQLHFCGNQDEYLVAALPPSQIFVWDIRRGVISQRIEIGKDFELCSIAVNQNQSDQQSMSEDDKYLCCALVRHLESSKMVVLVYNLSTGKQIRKVKVGSSSPQDVRGIAMNTDKNVIAIRNGRRMKIINLSTGATISKMKLKDEVDGQHHHYENDGAACMVSTVTFSQNCSVVGTTISNGACFFSILESFQENNDDDKKDAASGKLLGNITTSKADEKISDLQLYSISKDECIVTATEEKSGKVSLYELTNTSGTTSSSKKTFSAFATVDSSKANVGSSPSSSSSNKGKNLLARVGKAAYFPIGSMTAMKNVVFVETGLKSDGEIGESVNISTVPYRKEGTDDDNQFSLMTGNLYPKYDAQSESKDTTKNKKRKTTTADVSQITIGPGDSGHEAMVVTDELDQSSKRAKQQDYEFEEADETEDDENGTSGRKSIAEKLELLSSELDMETDEDADATKTTDLQLTDNADSKEIFSVKRATSDSLAFLLHQALLSNDETKLDLALEVTNRNVVEQSISQLCDIAEKESNREDGLDHLVLMLLSKIVTRMARRPNHRHDIVVWLRTIIMSLMSSRLSDPSEKSNTMTQSQKNISMKLGPLRNMLKERVDNLPQLLMLQGRLSMLTK